MRVPRNVSKSSEIEASNNGAGDSELLQKVLTTQVFLQQAKTAEIKFTEPIILREDKPVIYPRTINVIQGQAGVHKSRIAETLCSAMLKLKGHTNTLLEFTRKTYENDYLICYVDTERNLSDQLPYSLQQIQLKAGYDKTDNPPGFEYCSLLYISRPDRFEALRHYLRHLREKNKDKPIFIVLDVTTDCLADFNRVDDSLKLVDLLNQTINEVNVTFICVIHENPGSEKARGHFGTELMNKASTVIQVGYEKDATGNFTEMIRVKFLKCRSTAKHPPFYCKYSAEEKGLVLADAGDLVGITEAKKKKASLEELTEQLHIILGDGSSVSRKELLDRLTDELDAGERTITDRLKELIENNQQILNDAGKTCNLASLVKDKTKYFYLNSLKP